jgi:hypothetical protein
MAHNDTLCFEDCDVVTGQPTVDGFTGIGDEGVITNESEPGYVKGDRLTFGSGATTPAVFGSGSGFPPVVFQGVKNGNFLNLAFFCRFDLSFDYGDVVVIAIKPDPLGAQDQARRIDIFPLYKDVGADSQLAATGGPAGDKDDDADNNLVTNPSPPPNTIPWRTLHGVPPGEHYHIRTNKIAHAQTHYRGQLLGDPWTTTNPGGSAYLPSNIDIKVRSWQPPSQFLTYTTSAGTQTVSSTAFTFNVVSTASFANAGLFVVTDSSNKAHTVTYTGKTSTSFTGCTTPLNGTIAAATGVSIAEFAWSIEVALPLTTATTGGGSDWIDIPSGFGIYFNVIRSGSTAASRPAGGLGSYATEFSFPYGGSNDITGVLNATTAIPPASGSYGTGLIPALQNPPYSNLGSGIRFKNGELGVGVRAVAATAWSALGTTINNSSSAGTDNRLVAQIKNTGTTPADNATGIRAEFRFANWGLGSPNFSAWAPAIGATEDVPGGTPVPHGGEAEITATWLKANVSASYAPPNQHQCMWVQLTSNGVNPVNFLEGSVRRNMDFTSLSEISRPAEISGIGYPAPLAGNYHDFLLVTNIRKIAEPQLRGGVASIPIDPKKESVTWLWIVHGYRKTGRTITINNSTYEILDDTPGSFGYAAKHTGFNDRLEYEFKGPGLQHLGGNVHSIQVPHSKSIRIETIVRTVPQDKDKGKPVWWFWFVILVIILVIVVIWVGTGTPPISLPSTTTTTNTGG